MNKKTIQKVIDELKNEKPDLSYIRGILETLMDSEPHDTNVYSGSYMQIPIKSSVSVNENQNLTAAEQAAALAEAGFIKGTNPGTISETNIVIGQK